jgi:hypothetical protein
MASSLPSKSGKKFHPYVHPGNGLFRTVISDREDESSVLRNAE